MNNSRSGCLRPAQAAGRGSADDIWLAASWPFIASQLPPPPATIVELGCGQAGGHVPTLTRLGYQATGVDPEAPRGPVYEKIAFEGYEPGSPVNAVVASVSLHHADNLGAVLDHAGQIMSPRGAIAVIDWISEDFDEATARWCFRRRPRDPGEAGAWLAELSAGWAASRLPWQSFRQEWLDHHRLHPAAAIREELAGRFVTAHDAGGLFLSLMDDPCLLDCWMRKRAGHRAVLAASAALGREGP